MYACQIFCVYFANYMYVCVLYLTLLLYPRLNLPGNIGEESLAKADYDADTGKLNSFTQYSISGLVHFSGLPHSNV